MPCTGNSSEFCGGPDRIQIFMGPNPPRAVILPAGWEFTILCAQDSPDRLFVNTLIAGPELAATDTPAACVGFCADKGFTKAAVEGGDECYCGNEFRVPPTEISFGFCRLPCQGAPGVPCGGVFGAQVYELSS
ncbi:hypothetical protein EIP91_006315 [Steccherinum ochraceum]|uniref:WSC domain-containing protein n=1 Tax=Steccherinum ochraceum TaxID=92696 RepID=A0A4R0RVD0_9APHY|nr:hypothetical protein EIP91_006315 [Steccherinum ochraceum]